LFVIYNADAVQVKHEAECEFAEVDCEHAGWGCGVRQLRRVVRRHAATCHYAPGPCPVTTCAARIPRKYQLRHLAAEHGLRHHYAGPVDSASACVLMVFIVAVISLVLSYMLGQSC